MRQFREVELAYLREPCGFKKGHLRLVEAHRKKVRRLQPLLTRSAVLSSLDSSDDKTSIRKPLPMCA